MWGMIRKALGLTRLEQKVDTMNAKVSDVKAALDGIAQGLAPLPDRLTTVINKLIDLQNSANNPVTETKLTAEDQAALDAALSEASGIAEAVGKMAAALPAPAPTEPPPADGSGDGSTQTGGDGSSTEQPPATDPATGASGDGASQDAAKS